MNDILVKTSGAIKETWTKGVEFLIQQGGEWLKPRTSFALLFYGTYIYLTLKQHPVPEGLKTIVDLLMGFFFGSKVASRMNGGEK
jgi:hypothetical protein